MANIAFSWLKRALLFGFISLASGSSYCMDGLDDIFDLDFIPDDIEFDMKKSANPADILPLLIDDLDILSLLREPLYYKSYRLNDRSLLDMPFVRPYRLHDSRERKFAFQLFYNQTGRMYFSKYGDNISSYLGICNTNLLRKISETLSEDIIREQFPNFDLNPISIFPLFKNMTVQERRLGFMFSGSRKWSNFTFRAYAPIYYLERNFYLTPREQNAIDNFFGSNSSQADSAFQYQHFISDKIGLGDTRLICSYDIYECKDMEAQLGFQFTVPTAFAFKKGLAGSSFEQWKTLRYCQFSIQELWDLAQEDPCRATSYGSDFFLGALDVLSANLLDIPLGNNGHLGIGAFFQNKSRLSYYIDMPWAYQIQYQSTISLEYLVPKCERRFFLIKEDEERLNKKYFDEDRAEEDPEYAQRWLNLIEETFTNKMYPLALDTRVQPGVIFQWTSAIFHEHGPWRYQVGTDWYVQSQTVLESVEVPKPVGDLNINIKKAIAPFSYQSKICGGIYYSFLREKRDWNISLYGDYTYWNTGIGKDFTISLNVEVDF